MIINCKYTTVENGNWRELTTDSAHENRIFKFLASLSCPLPTRFTVLTCGQTGYPDQLVVHSFLFSNGSRWDAVKGMSLRSTLDNSYDSVHNDEVKF